MDLLNRWFWDVLVVGGGNHHHGALLPGHHVPQERGEVYSAYYCPDMNIMPVAGGDYQAWPVTQPS